jgi:predicted DNA-binding ribbon-helix-helix protein
MRHQPTAIQAGLAEGRTAPGASTLVNRNVTIDGRRTSLRLEPAMWDALEEICRREDMSQHELCAMIDQRRRASSLTAAIRVFIINYFRAAATEEGHAGIGHGALYRTRARAGGRARGTPGPRRYNLDPV